MLAVIGVYGMLSFSVARRANEIGIRMALGANRTRVLKMILKQGIGVVAGGLAAGMGAAFVLTRALSTLLFGVRPADPFSYLAVCIVLLCAGLIGSCIPARRATRVDPMVALRSE